MKRNKLTIVAVACGLACAVCIALFMVSVQGEANAARAEALARYGGEQVEVCVATRDVAAGERLEASAVETRLWIADLLPEGAVRESGEVVGKTATSSILKGEAISTKRFESTRNAFDIPAGKEAVSVPVKAVQAVGGAVQPGMSVDVYSSGDTSTALLANDVIVLDASVGNAGSLVSAESGWITLAVDAERVQEIISASNKTSLYFVIPGAPEQSGDQAAGKKSDSSKSAKSASAANAQPDQGDAGDAQADASEGEKADQLDSDAAAETGSTAQDGVDSDSAELQAQDGGDSDSAEPQGQDGGDQQGNDEEAW